MNAPDCIHATMGYCTHKHAPQQTVAGLPSVVILPACVLKQEDHRIACTIRVPWAAGQEALQDAAKAISR